MPNPTYESIIYERSNGIATISLNRPDVLNAVNEKMGRESERDTEVRCVIITGMGRAFCAGEDIQALRGEYERGENPKLGQRLLYKYNPIITRMRRMEKPVIAAVNGVAAGAGVGIAYSCDIRVGSEDAGFIQAFVRVGLAPDSSTSFFLPRLAGFAKALELSLTGDELPTKDAERFGLVSKVVPAYQESSQQINPTLRQSQNTKATFRKSLERLRIIWKP